MANNRELKIMFNKSGGNKGNNSYSPKLSIPKVWLDDMGITPEDRDVHVTYVNKEITIKKKEK